MATDFESALPVRNSTVTGYTSLSVTPDANAVFTTIPDPNAVSTVTPDTNAVFTVTPESNAQFEVIQANSVLLNTTVYGNDGSGNHIIKTDANGVVQVAVTSASVTNPVNAHVTSANLGTSAEVALEYNPSVSTFNFDSIWATASGKIKLEVYVHTSGVTSVATIRSSGTLHYTAFNSTANPNIDKYLENNLITVASGSSIYYIITNKDNQSQDVYGTVGGWS